MIIFFTNLFTQHKETIKHIKENNNIKAINVKKANTFDLQDLFNRVKRVV